MTRYEYELETNAAKFKTALRRFAKQYPEIAEAWGEVFEYMHENKQSFFGDQIMADGSHNEAWAYAIHLDENDGW